MGVGVVNRTSNIDSQLSELACLSKHLDCGAGQRGSDNQGWTVLYTKSCYYSTTLTSKVQYTKDMTSCYSIWYQLVVCRSVKV